MGRMRWAGSAALLLAGSGAAGVWAQQSAAPMAVAPPRALQQPAPPAMPRPRMPIPTAALLPDTQALLDGYVRAGTVPGAVVAVGVGDAPPLFVDSGRIADSASAPAAGPDSLWRVYSMTKPITAAAAMILIEEGKIGLDAPLSTYLPAFAHMRVLVDPAKGLASRPATKPITIRELLTHTAGIGYAAIDSGPLAREYERLGIVPAALSAATEAKARPVRAPTLAAFADRLATLPLLSEPGTQWHYSMALDLMGRVIEVASGMPFDRFVQARILDPLAMRSSFWTVPAADAARLATNYAEVAGRRVPVDPGAGSLWLKPPSFPYGGAGLVMSARDYDTFLRMLANGGATGGTRVMKPETAALMMSNLLPPGVVFGGITGNGRAAADPGGPTGYGAGGSVYTEAGPGGYPGKGTYGWGGAAGTVAFVDPVRHVRTTVMLNLMGGIPSLRGDLARALIADRRRLTGE